MSRFSLRQRYLVPLISTTVFYFFLLLLNDLAFGVENHYFGKPLKYWGLYFPDINFNGSLLPDLIVQIMLAYLLFGLSRRVLLFLSLQFILMSFLYAGNAINISFFGEPLTINDIHSATALYSVLPFLYKLLLLLPALFILLLLLYNFPYSRKNIVVAALLGVSIPAVFMANAESMSSFFDNCYPYKLWSPIENYQSRGATIYLTNEISREIAAKKEEPPAANTVSKAVDSLLHRKSIISETGFAPNRSIHIIAIESMWDASLLKSAGLTEDPLSSSFRELWDATGNSLVLSPVFGGGTANSEFEFLCGHPVSSKEIFFQTGMLNEDLPCLPNILRADGYLTIVSHPNRAGFWNRVNSYRRIGFDKYYSQKDFEFGDNERYLSDQSLFAQNATHIRALESERPLLNYVLTIAEHWPYKTESDSIGSSSEEPLVKGYVNLLKAGTESVINYAREVISNDPEALVVILGDHLPLLGKRNGAYSESGLFPGKKNEFTADEALVYTSTPLIIIDGVNGALDVGTVGMYELPNIILSLVGRSVPMPLYLFTKPYDGYVRPISGVGVLVGIGRRNFLCKEEITRKECKPYVEWLDRLDIISRDIRIGMQYALD